LNRIVDIELNRVYQRIHAAAARAPFHVSVADDAREVLLKEGFDARYGARHLRRAIERLLVQPLSNLMASGQIQHGDSIRVMQGQNAASLEFFRETNVRNGWKVAGSLAA